MKLQPLVMVGIVVGALSGCLADTASEKIDASSAEKEESSAEVADLSSSENDGDSQGSQSVNSSSAKESSQGEDSSMDEVVSSNTEESSSEAVMESSVVETSSVAIESSAEVMSSSEEVVVSSEAVMSSTASEPGAPLGSLTFTVNVIDQNKGFSPRHIIAAWIETENGDFVKTLAALASKRKQYLYTWNSATGADVTDAITGATTTTWGEMSVDWDCTGVDGAGVAEGNYVLRVEYTTEHAQGPMVDVPFAVGGSSETLSPSDEQYYTNMELVYTAN